MRGLCQCLFSAGAVLCKAFQFSISTSGRERIFLSYPLMPAKSLFPFPRILALGCREGKAHFLLLHTIYYQRFLLLQLCFWWQAQNNQEKEEQVRNYVLDCSLSVLLKLHQEQVEPVCDGLGLSAEASPAKIILGINICIKMGSEGKRTDLCFKGHCFRMRKSPQPWAWSRLRSISCEISVEISVEISMCVPQQPAGVPCLV